MAKIYLIVGIIGVLLPVASIVFSVIAYIIGTKNKHCRFNFFACGQICLLIGCLVIAAMLICTCFFEGKCPKCGEEIHFAVLRSNE